MFGLKSTVINATLAATFAIPVATAGLFVSAGSAQAAALYGEFQFQGGTTINPFAFSQVTLTSDQLTFTPQPITPIGIGSTKGNFGDFNTGNIGNIISFSSNTADNPFIDLGYLNIPGVIFPVDDTSSLTDNKNTFTLTSSNYGLVQSGSNVAIDVRLWGFFTSATGEISQGAGNLTFQANNTTVGDINTLLASGSSLSGLSFSGGAFTSVPEPTTFLGLGAIGAVMAVSRRRKAQASS